MKKKVTHLAELSQAIAELERKEAVQKNEIRESYQLVAENLKPGNLVKNGVRSVLSGKHNDEMLNMLIGLGTGILSKKVFFGRAKGFLGKTAGTALEWGMAALVSKNAEKLKAKGSEWIDKIFKKNGQQTHPVPGPGKK